MVGFGQSIGSMMHGRVDQSDMYRFALVQVVAALDTYIHGIVLDRSVDIIMGRLSAPTSSHKVGLQFGSIQALLSAVLPADTERLARGFVAQRLRRESFQHPDDIAAALAYVGVGAIWTSAFPAPGMAGTVKQTLSLIVERRNKIVHQSDMDPLLPGAVISLSDTDALKAINEVDTIVRAIEPFC